MKIPPAIAGLSLERKIFAGVILALLAVVGISRWQLHRSQAAAEKNALAASNAIAARDVTRAVALSRRDSLRILGDSLHAVEHLGVQQPKLSSSPLDRATNRTSVARGSVTVTPGRIVTSAVASSSTDSSDVRSATFHVDSSKARSSTRFVADVAVAIPRPPTQASLRLGVTLPPIELEPSLQCGKPDAGGIRPATLAIVAPNGIDVVVRSLELDVHACNPGFGKPRGIRVPLWVAGAGIGLGFVGGVILSR